MSAKVAAGCIISNNVYNVNMSHVLPVESQPSFHERILSSFGKLKFYKSELGIWWWQWFGSVESAQKEDRREAVCWHEATWSIREGRQTHKPSEWPLLSRRLNFWCPSPPSSRPPLPGLTLLPWWRARRKIGKGERIISICLINDSSIQYIARRPCPQSLQYWPGHAICLHRRHVSSPSSNLPPFRILSKHQFFSFPPYLIFIHSTKMKVLGETNIPNRRDRRLSNQILIHWSTQFTYMHGK